MAAVHSLVTWQVAMQKMAALEVECGCWQEFCMSGNSVYE